MAVILNAPLCIISTVLLSTSFVEVSVSFQSYMSFKDLQRQDAESLSYAVAENY